MHGLACAINFRIASIGRQIVGVDDRNGSIAVGKDSDLFILDGDPLDNISAGDAVANIKLIYLIVSALIPTKRCL